MARAVFCQLTKGGLMLGSGRSPCCGPKKLKRPEHRGADRHVVAVGVTPRVANREGASVKSRKRLGQFGEQLDGGRIIWRAPHRGCLQGGSIRQRSQLAQRGNRDARDVMCAEQRACIKLHTGLGQHGSACRIAARLPVAERDCRSDPRYESRRVGNHPSGHRNVLWQATIRAAAIGVQQCEQGPPTLGHRAATLHSIGQRGLLCSGRARGGIAAQRRGNIVRDAGQPSGRVPVMSSCAASSASRCNAAASSSARGLVIRQPAEAPPRPSGPRPAVPWSGVLPRPMRPAAPRRRRACSVT